MVSLGSSVETTIPLSVLVSEDVAVITLPVGDKYPSQNMIFATGARRGPKTREYLDLRLAAKTAGAIVAAQWGAISVPLGISLTLYQQSNRYPDASNLGKCELDGLQDAGLLVDDSLVRPATFHVEPGTPGPRRMVLVLTRPAGALRIGASSGTQSEPQSRAAGRHHGVRKTGSPSASQPAGRRKRASKATPTCEKFIPDNLFAPDLADKKDVLRRIGR